MSLPDFLRATLRVAGYVAPSGATIDDLLRAGTSYADVTTALSNIAGKSLAMAYKVQPSTWRSFAAIRSATTFKTQTALRPHILADLKLLPPSGEIKHGSLDESIYEFKVDTFARMLGIDRHMFVNDDAGIFADVIPGLARAAARSLSDLVWTTIMANGGNFFHANNANLITTALTVGNLASAIEKMRSQVDAEGNALDIKPRVLVVAPANEANARAILNSMEVSRSGADLLPTGNPMRDSGIVLEVEPRISNTLFPNYDSDDWFLFASPADAPVTVGFLQGQEVPTIESFGLDHDVNRLAFQFRVYHDYGVALSDPKAAVKSNVA